MEMHVLVLIRFFVYIFKFTKVFSFADQGLEKVVFNVEKYVILNNIQIYYSHSLNFV